MNNTSATTQTKTPTQKRLMRYWWAQVLSPAVLTVPLFAVFVKLIDALVFINNAAGHLFIISSAFAVVSSATVSTVIMFFGIRELYRDKVRPRTLENTMLLSLSVTAVIMLIPALIASFAVIANFRYI